MKRLLIAALVYGPGCDPAPALIEAVRVLRARGVAVAGLIQHSSESCAMELELLPSSQRMSITQKLGSCAASCRLDVAALAEASSIVRKAIDNAPSLVVFNKFGVQEAEGRGLRDEIAAAVTAGLPVLVPVGQRFLAQWSSFTGGEFTPLPCTATAVLSWWDALSDGQPS